MQYPVINHHRKEYFLKRYISGPITSWHMDGETMETVTDFIWGGPPKSLQTVTAGMKLKDACSLEEKL